MIPRQGGALDIILPLLGATSLSRFGSNTYAGGVRTVNLRRSFLTVRNYRR